MDLLENLRKVREEYERCTGYRYLELVTNGRTLIEYYRRGMLSPLDCSLRILIPDGDRQIVIDFLASWDGVVER